MIRGHTALVRQLRAFMEASNLPWGDVHFAYDRDDDGRLILDDQRLEVSFTYDGQRCDVVIFAPSQNAIDGVEPLPLGRLAARCNHRMVRGPIDQTTWDHIVSLIKSTADAQA